MEFRIDDEDLDVLKVVRPSIEVLSYIDISGVRRKGIITKRLTVNKSASSRYPRFEPLYATLSQHSLKAGIESYSSVVERHVLEI